MSSLLGFLFKPPGADPHPTSYTIADTIHGMSRRTLSDFVPEGWLEHVEKEHELEYNEATGLFQPKEPIIDPGEPNTLDENDPQGKPYRGQELAKRRIIARVYRAIRRKERTKFLFVGMAGTGKTALARCVSDLVITEQGFGRYFELLPGQIAEKEQLDTFMRGLDEGDVVYIDEAHVLKGIENLFHVLHETGMAKYPMSDGSWLEIPPRVHWYGATTNPGDMDKTNGQALLRRWRPEIRLEAPGEDVLAQILHDQDIPIGSEAAYEIVNRAGGLPWQALDVYEEAASFAISEGEAKIHMPHARTAFEVMGLDEKGLLPRDRSVIRALLQAPYKMLTTGAIRYRMAEGALCATSGVDKGTYKERVQPKLMRMGYLTTVGGQSLTEKAVQEYGHLV